MSTWFQCTSAYAFKIVCFLSYCKAFHMLGIAWADVMFHNMSVGVCSVSGMLQSAPVVC